MIVSEFLDYSAILQKKRIHMKMAFYHSVQTNWAGVLAVTRLLFNVAFG